MTDLTLQPTLKEALARLSDGAITAYREKLGDLVEEVNRIMRSHPRLVDLVGPSSLRMMLDNHRNHGAFMANVFLTRNSDLLTKILPWVYRSYTNHGFSPDYFPEVLCAWEESLKAHLPRHHEELRGVYEAMGHHHDSLLKAMSEKLFSLPPVEERWQEVQKLFLEALIRGDFREAQRLGEAHVATSEDVEAFYLNVLQASLYEVGRLWEEGWLSVAREHLASTIVSRLISTLYVRHGQGEITKGRAIITAAPNEFHEIGAWMVANCLEQDGWDVSYLGANTPVDDLMALVGEVKPHLLGISLAMPFNLEGAMAILKALNERALSPRVMVGGAALSHVPSMARLVGAQGQAWTCKEAVEVARRWWEEMNS